MDELATPGRTRNLSPWFAWMTQLGATEVADRPPLDEPVDPAEVAAWRDRCRERLTALLGPEPEPVPLDLETTEVVEADGYTRSRVVFDAEALMSVPAYLLVPDDRRDAPPGPAVLAVHGHGPGKAEVCGLEPTETPNGDYAHQLAQRGYVVLAPDMRCFGERVDWNPPDKYACDTNLVHAVMAGISPLTQNLFDARRCLDVLAGHPLVDPERIGMVGLSYGATITLFTAALDDRVAAAVVSGYLSSWAEAHKMPWNMCGSQVLPGMLGRIEHVDVAALIAPRPLLVETGTEDLLFPEAAARQTVEQLRSIYAHLDDPASPDLDERLVDDVFNGDHQWHGVAAFDFLDRWLRSNPPVSG